MRDLNLAGRPFVNLKPIRRASLLMLLVALGMLVINAMLYWEHFTGEGQTRSKSQDLTREINEEEAEIERLRRQISAVDIEGLNRRTRFVNLEVDRRRFAWSRLFDQLAEVQPGTVLLHSMSPWFSDERTARKNQRLAWDEVAVELEGVAKSGEAILEFVDNLFLHPAFRDPDLSREALREDGMSNFSLSVLYLPRVEEEPASLASEAGEAVVPAGDSDDEDAA